MLSIAIVTKDTVILSNKQGLYQIKVISIWMISDKNGKHDKKMEAANKSTISIMIIIFGE